MDKPTIIFYRRGELEQGDLANGYKRVDGYSADSETGAVQYPWLTRKQCRRLAAKVGSKAIFINKQ